MLGGGELKPLIGLQKTFGQKPLRETISYGYFTFSSLSASTISGNWSIFLSVNPRKRVIKKCIGFRRWSLVISSSLRSDGEVVDRRKDPDAIIERDGTVVKMKTGGNGDGKLFGTDQRTRRKMAEEVQ
jgi:hypothetical protein